MIRWVSGHYQDSRATFCTYSFQICHHPSLFPFLLTSSAFSISSNCLIAAIWAAFSCSSLPASSSSFRFCIDTAFAAAAAASSSRFFSNAAAFSAAVGWGEGGGGEGALLLLPGRVVLAFVVVVLLLVLRVLLLPLPLPLLLPPRSRWRRSDGIGRVEG